MTPTTPTDAADTTSPLARTARRVAAITLVLLAALGAFAAPAHAQKSRPADPAAAEAEFVRYLNEARASRGLAPLQVHPNLTRDARAWSGVMAQRNQMVHTTSLAEDTARSLPNWARAGENIGKGWEVRELHDAFVASPVHWANIIGDYHYVGVGVVYTSDRTWVTFRFAKVQGSEVAGTSTRPVVSPAIATGQVRRLYLAFFKREPDAAGSNFWVSKVSTGYPLGSIAGEFIKSAEFRATYGHLTDGQFITMVYRNVLNRDPDRSGYDYWVRRMAEGMGRGSVMVNFSESAEFRAKTA
jgi:uncharacterized protein YkwD